MKTLTTEQCPVCGMAASVPAPVGSYDGLCECAGCGTVRAREFADPSEIYVDGYLLDAGRFGVDVRHPRFQAYLASAVRRRLDLLERVLPRGSVLDVGCGTGETLEAFAERGWDAVGVEPVPDAAAFAAARGVRVVNALLEDAGLPERAYDVVSAMHVLEHLADSVAFLRLLARRARPGGHVVVEVPNFASRARLHHADQWVYLCPMEHVVHFTPASLRRAFVEAGLEPVKIVTPTYVGPPQTLDEALTDLARPRARRTLAPLSPRRPVLDDTARVPSRVAWAALRAVEAVHRRSGQGAVVLSVARVA